MKKIILLSVLSFLSIGFLKAQCTFNINISTTNATCNGSNNGTLAVAVSGGQAPFTYQLNQGTPQSSNSFSGLGASTYTVYVSDASPCTDSAVFNITEPVVLISTVGSTVTPSCLPGCDGIVSMMSTGGVAPYTYTVSPNIFINPIGSTLSGFCSGTIYTITTIDANGCISTATTVLPMLPPVTVMTSNIIQPSCSPGCDGSVTVTGTGGSFFPFTYAISPTSTAVVNPNGAISGLCSGTYTITATDVNGCTGTTLVTMFNSNGLAYTSTSVSCFGMTNGSIIASFAGGTAPYTYTLNGGSPNTSGIFNNLAAGIYTVMVVDANNNSCSNVASVSSPAPITANLSGALITCGIASNITTSVFGGTSPYLYTLQPGGISNSSGVFPVASAGTYTVSITDNNGCQTSASISSQLISNALTGVSLSINAYDESCNLSGDGSVNLTATPSTGLSYTWSNGATTQDLINVGAGTYSVLISNSNGDCTTLSDSVGVAGNNCGTISGKVYLDSMSDCVFNTGDVGLINRQITLSNGATTFTDAMGEYQFSNVPFGNFTITQAAGGGYAQNSCTQPSIVSLSAGSPIANNIDFKDSALVTIDESLYLISTQYVPGIAPTWMGAWIKLEIVNNNFATVQNKVTLLLNDSLDFAYSSIAPASIVSTPNGDSLTWFVTNPPNSSWYNSPSNEIIVYLNTPITLTLGTTLTSCATLTPLNVVDVNMSNNVYCVSKNVASSFDPNDKTVQPEGKGAAGYITLADKQLDYRIRFQNTGTAPAHNIYIMDTLSNKLDINTFEVLGYSHPYEVEVINNSILKFKFNNIMLPDSGTNMQASNGYITYRIKQKATNQIGDVIKNTAAIYFDFNAPVITNTTVNTIWNPTLVEEIVSTKLLVYPNPSKGVFYVTDPTLSKYEKQVLNALGQVVYTSREQTLNLSHLSRGTYTLRVKTNEASYVQKLMLE